MSTFKTLSKIWQDTIPGERIKSVVEWGRQHVKLIGSARSESFNPEITPWIKEPLERTADGTPSMTFVKPVQTGGSVVGEVALCYQVANSNGGDIQYNWQNDSAADARWSKRFERILEACEPVMARAPKDRNKWKIGLIMFPHLNFIMQGVHTNRNVASDSIRFQINEEIHDEQGGWHAGRLDQANGRLTAFWNSFSGQISNAGYDGDQLHKRFLAGTQQVWTVKCPGCGLFHPMRTEWDDRRPELGGLRYDADGCRIGNWEYDYTKMLSSIRVQMPCGYSVHDDINERRSLSLTGKYSDGAPSTERSYTLEAVSIDYIPFVNLVKQKHAALKALEYGDPEPYSVYYRERECRFYKKGVQPITQNILLSTSKKDRAGIPDRDIRVGAGDFQKGKKKLKELPHNWHVIADAKVLPDGRLRVLIVSEGKEPTHANLVDLLKRHELIPSCCAMDSSWDTENIYQLCMAEGYYALKGEEAQLFAGHEDGSRKVYSPPEPLHLMCNQPSKYPYIFYKGNQVPNPDEPMWIRYSKPGLMSLVNWMRTSPNVVFEIPEDVSEDFKLHLDAWKLEQVRDSKSQELKQGWVSRRDEDHLFQCLCYIALLLSDAGFIGIQKENETK